MPDEVFRKSFGTVLCIHLEKSSWKTFVKERPLKMRNVIGQTSFIVKAHQSDFLFQPAEAGSYSTGFTIDAKGDASRQHHAKTSRE